MINIDNKTRRLSQATIVIGYKQENKAESIEFEIPDYLKEYGKKICFKTKDGKVFSKLFDNMTSSIFTFTRTETQYGELDATIQFFKTENEDMVIYKTSMLHIIFNESVICEDEVQPDEPKIPILESLIEKVTELNNTITESEEIRNNDENTRISNENERKTNEKERETYYTNIQDKVNNGEFNGATYLPNVDAEGNISWTNNKGLENPSSQNIRGPQGIQGAQGEPFKIKKTYSSIEEMQTDFDNMKVGDYAMIANSVEIEDNAKLYYRTETEWVFITDFSGATGIQGPQGAQGIQGIQGERGIGISRLEVKDGYLYVTLTDNTQQNAGLIITDEVKQWIVNQVTDNAKSKFNTYYDGKVTDFDNHATVKTNEFNTNATNKVNEYNQNAESLINRVAECETENERLRADIKSIALPGEASGENIHIEDSSEARCEIKICGNHQQDTREGYNLLNLEKYVYSETISNINGGKIEVSKGIVNLNGTNATARMTAKSKDLASSEFDIIPAGTYFFGVNCNLVPVSGGSLLQPKLGIQELKEDYYLTQWYAICDVNKTESYPLLISKDTQKTTYEQYGASPSIDYPSKVKSVNGSAKTDISNKNYLSKIPKKSITAQGITSTFDGEKFICKGTAQTNYFNLFTEKVYKKISKGIKTFSTNKLKKGRVFIHFDYVDGTVQNYYTSINTNQVRFTLNKDVKSYRLNVDSITAGDTIDDNIYVQLEDGNIATEIEKAENQEYLVDVQQEMMDGDTFVRQENKWYEKHGWEKVVFNGTEKFLLISNNRFQFNLIKAQYPECINSYFTTNVISNVANGMSLSSLGTTTDNYRISANYDSLYFKINESSMEDFKLKELYDAGTPAVAYYKLAEPILLECTEAQSKVLNEIYNKAHTYKNITNISAESAEVNPIVSLKYLKDTEKYIEDKITTALTKINANN